MALVEAVLEALVQVEALEEALVEPLMQRVQKSLRMVEIALSSRVAPAPLVQATPAQARPLAKVAEDVAQVMSPLEEHQGLEVAPIENPEATLPQVAHQVGAQALEKAATVALELRVLAKIGMMAEVALQGQLLGRVLLAGTAASMLAAEGQACHWLKLVDELAQVVLKVGDSAESFLLEDWTFLVPLVEAVTTIEMRTMTFPRVDL